MSEHDDHSLDEPSEIEEAIPHGEGSTPPDDSPATPGNPPLLSLTGEAESVQHTGMEGKQAAKHYLESTTRISLSWDAYENPAQCTLLMLDGSRQRYDLKGRFFASKHETFVEVKNYSTAGNQVADFNTFLAQAYSATAKVWQELADPEYEFFWVTWHPFGTLTNWSKLDSPEQIKAALEDHPELLNGQQIDQTVLTTVASRIWLLVLHRRHKELTPSPAEIGEILLKLGRN